MENCANEWNLILFDRYTPVNDKIGYGENRESLSLHFNYI